ncbi:MAG: NAD(P)/FAD-dependent oxidoreductase [Clostridia bacterium]|nr:NAD(P)/FAD-dependent oxidoreductase [Clostridia bacterium]
MYDCIIIGAGPAGMMAASAASDLGKSVLLIEKNKMAGRKLRITGKGRCNVTNVADSQSIMRNINENGRFLFSALSAFDSDDTVTFFESIGVPLKTERGGRVFPQSDKAVDVAEAMYKKVLDGGCKFACGEVSEVLTENGCIVGVRLKSGKEITAKSVIIATGGLSYPLTGSTGDGYRMAKSLGHRITPPRAALVPIETKESWPAEMQGLSLKNVKLTLKCEDKSLFSDQGEMLFTHFGISGPLCLSASCHIKDLAKDYVIEIDLKPALDEKTLDARLLKDFSKYINRDFINALDDLLPAKMIPVFVSLSGIDPRQKVNEITKPARHTICNLLKNMRLTVKALRPIDEAIITAGGINVKEINPSTMESKLVPGLYFAGEVIDVSAYTGGYNLQIAFSTGYLAGCSC